jgi:hypothetical protein
VKEDKIEEKVGRMLDKWEMNELKKCNLKWEERHTDVQSL